LTLARQSAVDIALLDFNMPGRDGLSLAADLRAQDENLLIAIVSANHQTEVVGRARELGATFLVKPLNEQSLKSFLDEAERQLKARGA
jgi:YesN/AraC family two-component response regulator